MSYAKYVKMLGLAAVAAMAVMALTGVASASATQFKAETYPVTVKSHAAVNIVEGKEVTSNQVFKTNAGTVSCEAAAGSGSANAASEWMKIKVSYSKCTAFGFIGATINMGTCEYEFHTNGTVDIVPSGCKVTITVSGSSCVVEVPSQTGLKTVSYENKGTGTTRTIREKTNVTGITYTQNAFCSGGSGTFSNGEYTGENEVEGFNEALEREGIWVE